MVGRVLFVAGGLLLGSAVATTHRLIPSFGGVPSWASSAGVGALCGAVVAGALLAAWGKLAQATQKPDAAARLLNAGLGGTIGAALGFTLSFILGKLFPLAGGVLVAQGCLVGGCTLFGLAVGAATRSPLWRLGTREDDPVEAVDPAPARGTSKVLDTSVIIDGRIGDLVATGFLEGEILIPEFVLDELQGIADSADGLRRKKGRRGLEILRLMMENHRVGARVLSRDYPSIAEVDRKLIRLAKEESAILVTTDYNLNRVAQVEGIAILNVNELAKALRPRFVPGEQVEVEIMDRGAEINQGVGYLDDGTMIVVENGRRHVGRTIRVTVKSTLQTDAGRMLFAEPANEIPRWEKERDAR